MITQLGENCNHLLSTELANEFLVLLGAIEMNGLILNERNEKVTESSPEQREK